MRKNLVFASALLLFATTGFGALAQTSVTVDGCPAQGVEKGCIVIKGQDGATYDISSAKPRPRINYLGIHLTGTKTDKASICQQGVVLDKIKWSYTRQKCSKP